MKVLFYYFTLPHYRFSLFQRLQEKYGWKISIVYPERMGSSCSITGIDSSEEFREYFELLPLVRKSAPFPFQSFFYLSGFGKSINFAEFDFVVFQGSIYDLSSIAGLYRCRREGVPCALWNKGYAAESVRNPGINRIVFRPFYRLPHVFIPYGDMSARYFERLGVKAGRIVSSYNTVNVEEIAEKAIELRQAGRESLKELFADSRLPTVGTVGRLVEKKRASDLVLAVAFLRREGVHVNCFIGGSGPQEPELRDLIEREDLGKRVVLLGSLPKGYDNAVLAAADVAVFCGGHGLAINQAMALGVPVIVSDDISPDSEMVRDGDTGWLFKKGDASDLAEKISMVTSMDREGVGRVCENSKNEILGRRNEEKYAEAFQKAYEVAREIAG